MVTQHIKELPPRHKKLRGFALVFVLAFAAVITVFTATAGAQAAYNLRLATNRGQTDRAYYAANSGTQLALSLLREPPVAFDYLGDNVEREWLESDASVYYSMPSIEAEAFSRVFHNIEGYSNARLEAPDGTKIPPEHFYIISLGNLDGNVYDGVATEGGVQFNQATMGSTLKPTYPIMPQAAFAFDKIEVKEAIVDHFDSRAGTGIGPWTPAHDAVAGGGGAGGGGGAAAGPDPKEFPEASIATEKTDPVDITISSSSAKIYGHVLLGSTATPADITALANKLQTDLGLSGAGIPTTPDVHQFGRRGGDNSGDPSRPVTGRIDKLSGPKVVPSMEFSSENVVSVSSLTNAPLDEGKIYYYSASPNLTVGSGSSIQVKDTNNDGKFEDIVILVDRNITFNSGSSINKHRSPRQVKFYSLEGGNFTVNSGSKDNYCLVAGQDLNITLKSDSELWGAVLGKTITLENDSKLHYDVQLRDPLEIADLYGFTIESSVVTPGGRVNAGALGPSGAAGGGGGTTDTTTGGTTTGGTTAGGTTGGGGGCGGCGGGSMMMAEEMKELN